MAIVGARTNPTVDAVRLVDAGAAFPGGPFTPSSTADSPTLKEIP